MDFALTAVRGIPNPNSNQVFDLDDPNCGAGNGVPTSEEPTCGHLLTTGAEGPVVMSVGSCEGLGPDPTTPLLPAGQSATPLPWSSPSSQISSIRRMTRTPP